jgi:hypothetical protein
MRNRKIISKLYIYCETETEQKNLLGSACFLLHAGLLLGLSFEPEGRVNIFLQNASCLPADYTAIIAQKTEFFKSHLLGDCFSFPALLS